MASTADCRLDAEAALFQRGYPEFQDGKIALNDQDTLGKSCTDGALKGESSG